MQLRGREEYTYHVESHDILKGYLALPVPVYQSLVDDLRATSGWQAEYKWLAFSWSKLLDAACLKIRCDPRKSTNAGHGPTRSTFQASRWGRGFIYILMI